MKVKGDANISRNTTTRSVGYGKSVTTVGAATLTLDNYSTTTQIFIGSVAGQSLNLGDTTQYVDVGLMYVVINDSTQNLLIKNNAGTTLITLKPNFSLLAFLEENSTANGTWRFCVFIDRTLEALGESSRGGYICGFDGKATVGRWLEFYANNPSDQNPAVVAEPGRIRALSLSASANSTGTVTVFINGVAVETISLTASKTARKKTLNHGVTDLDLVSLQVTSGSISRPMVIVYIQTY